MQLGVPIVPVSLVGSFQHFRTGHWLLRPATVKIVLHDTIDTKDLRKEDVAALRHKVRQMIAEPLGDN
jgi:1-acyl-sn-glycerol-3-phosphate acyltransferase